MYSLLTSNASVAEGWVELVLEAEVVASEVLVAEVLLTSEVLVVEVLVTEVLLTSAALVVEVLLASEALVTEVLVVEVLVTDEVVDSLVVASLLVTSLLDAGTALVDKEDTAVVPSVVWADVVPSPLSTPALLYAAPLAVVCADASAPTEVGVMTVPSSSSLAPFPRIKTLLLY